jgi:hypothetical protein
MRLLEEDGGQREEQVQLVDYPGVRSSRRLRGPSEGE